MRKQLKLLGIILVFSLIYNTYGQTSLTQAVDFTAVDTEGNTRNLFNELDQGKYVLIEFFFTT